MHLNGRLRTDTFANPYQAIEHVYDPEVYVFAHQSSPDRLVQAYHTALFDTWPLNVPISDTLNQHSIRLPGLTCLLPSYADALLEAIRQRPRAPVPTNTRFAQDADYWVIIWPWLTPAVRHALRPYLTRVCQPYARTILALIDEQAPLRHPPYRTISSWAYTAHPVTLDDWRRLLDTIGPVSPQMIAEPFLRLLLHFAPTEILDELTIPLRQAHAYHHVPLISYPMASASLLSAISTPPHETPHEQPEWWTCGAPEPVFATVPVERTVRGLTGRALLFALSHWTWMSQVDAPGIVVQPTPEILTLLQEEAEGPYADLAILIARRIPHHQEQPDFVRTLAHTPLDLSYHELEDALAHPDTPLPALARCLHAMMTTDHPIGFVARPLAQHPRATRDFALRCASHSSPDVQASGASALVLTTDDDEHLLLHSHPRIREILYHKRPMTRAMIEHALQRATIEDKLAVAAQPALDAQAVQQIFETGSVFLIQTLARAGTLTPELARQLVTSPEAQLRAIAAASADTDTCTLLALDRRHCVVDAVASNPHADRQTVEFLAKRHGKRLARVLVTHPNLSDQTRITLTLLIATLPAKS